MSDDDDDDDDDDVKQCILEFQEIDFTFLGDSGEPFPRLGKH